MGMRGIFGGIVATLYVHRIKFNVEITERKTEMMALFSGLLIPLVITVNGLLMLIIQAFTCIIDFDKVNREK